MRNFVAVFLWTLASWTGTAVAGANPQSSLKLFDLKKCRTFVRPAIVQSRACGKAPLCVAILGCDIDLGTDSRQYPLVVSCGAQPDGACPSASEMHGGSNFKCRAGTVLPDRMAFDLS